MAESRNLIGATDGNDITGDSFSPLLDWVHPPLYSPRVENDDGAAAEPQAAASDALPSGPHHLSRRPLIPAIVWIGLVLFSLAARGCPEFSAFYAVFLAVSLLIPAAGALFLIAAYYLGKGRLLPAFKKFTGYAIVLHYVASSLPRVKWAEAGFIGEGRAVFMYVLTLACVAAGCVLFAVMGRKKVLVSFGVITAEEASDPALLKKNRKAKTPNPIAFVLEWVDVIASALIAVILINIFAFQLYIVPTESMVPVFLSGDRPFTVKLLAGPRLPLTEWRLPFFRAPARGDVVTIANPRYPENSGVNLRKYLSQFVSMATITLVTLDKRPDPLVKRIVGMPGEKLMMVDDQLYVRTAKDPDFTPLAIDRERFAQIDLWKLPMEVRNRIGRDAVIDERGRRRLADLDARKNGIDPARLAEGLRDQWRGLEPRLAALSQGTLDAFERDAFEESGGSLKAMRDLAMSAGPAGAGNFFSGMGISTDDVSIALAIARSLAARAALKEYSTSALSSAPGPTAYERGSRRLNLLIKQNLLSRVELDIGLIASGSAYRSIIMDPRHIREISEATELSFYLGLYDSRNFPEFPSGGAFLGPDQYFAMGDNRYNSLDFRFSETTGIRPLDPSDPASILYHSQLAPFPLEKRYIEGYAVFRVWPLSRLGVIR
jgi:signal peptidase I